MNEAVTFDGAPPTGTINFGIGQPSANLLPVELLRNASATCLQQAEAAELNYGALPGDQRFLDSLAHYLRNAYDAPVSAESLFVSGGNSQALDLVSTVFARPGDTVFVEEPSYFLAFQIFRDHGLKLVGIPMDEDGMDIDLLEQQLAVHQPSFLYTIPTYHNPGGQTLSQERRLRLLELSRQHDFLIVADEVYQQLSYFESPPPAFGTHCDRGTVLSLGSFSKILAPALRLGWIQTCHDLRQKLLANGFVNSGGSINHFTSHIVRHVLETGRQEKHIGKLRDVYRSRVAAMDQALAAEFGSAAKWTRPNGGYFFWLTLDQSIDTAHLREAARKLETGFQPGHVFSSTGGLRNCLRLSFAQYDEADIRDGISRLREACQSVI